MNRHRRPAGQHSDGSVTSASEALTEVGTVLRRLIPFPGIEPLAPMPDALRPADAGPLAQQPASVVAQAASILDEEMARGVVAARTASPSGGRIGTGALDNPLIAQAHDVVNQFAAVWPSLQHAVPPLPGAPSGAPADTDPVAELRPKTTVRAGQRATISMMLGNSEPHPVRLVAAATDLLGSRGGQIAASLLELSPRECQIQPGAQRDLAISVLVPPGTAPGCYAGLLVVRGVDYLRALITIDVE